MKYGKLVRDKIPDIIEANGEVPIYHVLDENILKKHLLIKLMEEYKEVIHAYIDYQMYVKNNYDNPSHLIEELGDFLEVLFSLAKMDDIEAQELMYLGQFEEVSFEENMKTCLVQLKKMVYHIDKVRQIHKQDYIQLIQLYLFFIDTLGLQNKDVLKSMFQKREARGGFDNRIYLENVVQKEYTK